MVRLRLRVLRFLGWEFAAAMFSVNSKFWAQELRF
jgi:hypothetical protein